MRILIGLFGVLLISGCSTKHYPMVPISETRAKPSILENGQVLFYQDYGIQNKNTPFVLLHGFGGYSGSWSTVPKHLAKKHPVYAVDMAGYGYSNWPDDYDFSIKTQAEYVNEIMSNLGINNAVIVGHDIGGGVAQILAVNHPERVKSLVLINSVVDKDWPSTEIRLLRFPVTGYLGITLLEGLIWEHMMDNGFYDTKKLNDKIRSGYQRWYQGSEGRTRLVRNAQALDNSDLVNIRLNIHSLSIPTLMLKSENDYFLDRAPAKNLCANMKNCEFHLIAKAGHFVMEEDPLTVSTYLLAFVK